MFVHTAVCQAWRHIATEILIIMQRPDPKSANYKEFCRLQEKLCERIKSLREERGYTQEDMTDFELSLRQYQRMEQDPGSIVSLWQVYKIAKAFNLNIDELLQ